MLIGKRRKRGGGGERKEGDVRVKLGKPKITRVMDKFTLLTENEREKERSVLQKHQSVTFDWLAGR